MAVFRVEKTNDFTVMSNHHLKNIKLSLKGKGLLSLMLSLPEDWDYTTKGLAAISKEGVDSIQTTIKELEDNGYLIRKRLRNEKGQLMITEYIILEQPKLFTCDAEPNDPLQCNPKQESPEQCNPEQEKPQQGKPQQGKPERENPVQASPGLENPAQLSTKELSTKESSTKELNTNQSINLQTSSLANQESQPKTLVEDNSKIVRDSLEYSLLCLRYGEERVQGITQLVDDTLACTQKRIRLGGKEYPAATVKDAMRSIDVTHIEYILDCVDHNAGMIRNIKGYLLTALFNAPKTIDNNYAAKLSYNVNNQVAT